MKIQIAELINDSIVDGKGLRLAIYVQGCSHHCKAVIIPKLTILAGKNQDTEEIWKVVKKIHYWTV